MNIAVWDENRSGRLIPRGKEREGLTNQEGTLHGSAPRKRRGRGRPRDSRREAGATSNRCYCLATLSATLCWRPPELAVTLMVEVALPLVGGGWVCPPKEPPPPQLTM